MLNILLSDSTDSRNTIQKQDRPLGPVSYFVTDELPGKTSDIVLSSAENIAQDGMRYLESHPPRSRNEASLAHLDASMLHKAVLQTSTQFSGNIFETLMNQTAAISRSIPGLTYEGLIYANPLTNDPRTFLSSTEREEELLFYETHLHIEHEIAAIVDALSTTLCQNNKDVTDEFCLTSLMPVLQKIEIGMSQLAKGLQERTFVQLRPFFMHDEKRNIKGPSGLYSAGIFCLDAYIAGNIPAMKKFLSYKMGEKSYYPHTSATTDSCSGQDDMERAMGFLENGKALHTMDSPVLRTIAEQMLAVRKVHMGLAYKFIIKNMGEVEGTARTNIREFLKIPFDIYQALSAKI